MKRYLCYNKIHNVTFFVLVITISFAIFHFGSVVNASSESYDSGYDHGCEDTRIANPSDREINDPDNRPESYTKEFMAGYYDGFNECSVGSNNISGDGNVTLGAECGVRLLIDDQSFQPLSEHQCFYFNSCKNLGGSIPGCYESARTINCDIESGIRYNCPAVALGR